MKNLVSACLVGILLFPVVTKSQFLPPGLPLPDNRGEDVMADHLVVGSTIHLVWASNVDHTGTAGTDPDIFYIRYDGLTWSAPVLVNSYGALDNATGHDERLPRLARGPDGRLHCVWQSRYPLQGGTDWDVMYASLVDSSWSTAQALTGAPLDEVLPTVVTRQNGDPVVVWQNSLGELHYRVRGADTWSADQRLFTPPLGSTGSDSGPVALARSSDGLIVAVWSTTHDLSGTMGTDADVVFSELPPGAPWTTPVPISDHAYGDSGADINPAVVLLNEGTDLEIHVVWESTSDLFGNGTEGDLLGAVYRFPADGSSANPTYLVNSNGLGDQHGDHLPSLCVEPGGVVHVAWQTQDAFVGDLDVLHAHNATPGGLWSHFDLLGQNGYFDGPGENDSLPDLECSTLGVLSGVWQSTDDLGGWLSGGDHELFHALGFGLEVSRPEPIIPGADFDTGDEFGIVLVVDDWGVMHAVFGSNEPSLGGHSGSTDIFYTRNEGSGWSQPELVSDFGADAGDPFNYWAPRLAVDNQQRVHVIWSSNFNLGGVAGTDHDVLYAIRDKGVWSPPELVNSSAIDLPMSDDIVLDLKIAPDGTPHAIWGDAIWGDDDTFYSRLSWSKRTGTGWVVEEPFDTPVNPSGFSSVHRASLWVDAQGAPHICWTSDSDYLGSGTDFDVLYSTRSADSWSTPVYVNDAWRSDVADEDECRLVGLPDDSLLVVTTSNLDRDGAGAADVDLFASRKSVSGWQPMELLLEAARTDNNNELWPVVDIRNNLLVVAWKTREPIGGWGGNDDDIAFAVVDLSAPLPSAAPLRWVNTTALGDDALPLSSNADIVSSVSYSLSGRVHFAWNSTLDRLGTGQSDWDVYHAWIDVPIPLLSTDGL